MHFFADQVLTRTPAESLVREGGYVYWVWMQSCSRTSLAPQGIKAFNGAFGEGFFDMEARMSLSYTVVFNIKMSSY
jgi:hypothetical protein